MVQYGKITALYSCLSVGDKDRDGGESNSRATGYLWNIKALNSGGGKHMILKGY